MKVKQKEKIVWFQVKYMYKASEEEKPLTYLKIKTKIADFWIKYFMLAFKIIVIKITKKGISSSRIKVMHSLRSKNMPVSGSIITKPFILLHLTSHLGRATVSIVVLDPHPPV